MIPDFNELFKDYYIIPNDEIRHMILLDNYLDLNKRHVYAVGSYKSVSLRITMLEDDCTIKTLKKLLDNPNITFIVEKEHTDE